MPFERGQRQAAHDVVERERAVLDGLLVRLECVIGHRSPDQLLDIRLFAARVLHPLSNRPGW